MHSSSEDLCDNQPNSLLIYLNFPGVLMWEVFTEGKMPFETNTNYEVVTMISQGHRLFRPKLASKSVYDLMMMCWHEVCYFMLLSSLHFSMAVTAAL